MSFDDPWDLNVQFPVYTPINPDQAIRPPGAIKCYEFIAKFTAKDTSPVTVVDAATQAQRDAQVIRLTRSLLAPAADEATDAQVLQLHRDYMAGRYG